MATIGRKRGRCAIMIPLVEQHLKEIEAICREFGVLKLEVFGSAVTGEFDSDRSDIDLIVEFPAEYDFGPWLARFQELKERLEEVFDRPVDLVMAKAMRRPRFIASVNENRRLLYAA